MRTAPLQGKSCLSSPLPKFVSTLSTLRCNPPSRAKARVLASMGVLRYLVLLIAVVTAAAAQQDNTSNPKRLSIEERTIGVRNVSLEVTREILKRCPSAITVTDNREAADYFLRIAPGASALYRQNGDAAHVFPARWKASNLAKEVCGFVASQH